MKVIEIRPRGFCPGVVKALQIVENVINDPTLPKPVHVLGMIVHNRHVVDELTSKDVITHDNLLKSRLELVEEITSGTVVITAHGTSPDVFERLREKQLPIVDATCKDVWKTHRLVRAHLQKGDTILFIGKNHHPETEGILGIDPSIHLIETIQDIQPNLRGQIYVTNQTTLSIADILPIHKKILEFSPDAIIEDEICDSTRRRQEALIQTNSHGVDLCLIVGDPRSNNSKQLVEISIKLTNTPTHLIESVQDIQPSWLENIHTVSVSAGASTPNHLTREVIEFLEKM